MTFEFAKTHPPLPAQLAKILRLWSCGYLRTITNIVPTIKLARIEYIKKNVSFLLMKGYSIQITYAKNKQPERMVTSDDLTSCSCSLYVA
jgi:ribulose bisphosphate carboxylase small subunit